MSKYEKGRAKTGGRAKGTKNKTSSFIERCQEMKLDLVACLIDDLKDMAPFQRVEYWVKLMEFHYPKQKNVELSNPEGSEGFKLIIEDYGSKK